MRRTLIFAVLIIQHLAFAVEQESLPSPYEKITVLPELAQGWFINQKQLNDLFFRYKINTVIELGSFLGLSTMHMAKLLPQEGKIYAVDHWLGSADHQLYGESDVSHLLPTLYEQFLSNIIHNKLTDKIIPVRMTTEKAASYLSKNKIRPDLIYVDASHDEESVFQDLELYYPLLKKGGDIVWG